MHDIDGGAQSEGIGDKASREVRLRESSRPAEVRVLGTSQVLIEPEAEGDKDSWDNNISQTQHGKLVGLVGGESKEEAGEDDLDGGIKVFGDRDHDLGSKDPKDVVEEETREEDHTGLEGVQGEELDGVEGEADAEDVGGDPVLCRDVVAREEH